MICKFGVRNFKPFDEKVEIDFFANGNIKRFDYNLINVGDKSVLKTAGFYGPNNTGKTWILGAILALRSLMLNIPHDDFSNSFAGVGPVTSFSVEYCIENRFYEYELSYNNQTQEYEKEKLFLKLFDNKSRKTEKIFERDKKTLFWKGMSEELKDAKLMKFFSLAYPFMAIFNNDESNLIKQAKEDYIKFANSIMVVEMEKPINIDVTLNLIQNNSKARNFIREFVKNCDLHIEDFGFDEDIISDVSLDKSLARYLHNPNTAKENLKFYSKHNGLRVPSILFESNGTLKLVGLSGYIYKALTEGNILLIDEIESSLHHIITKSIVAMFNNMLNKNAQLLFTTHDVLLLDLKNLFRKDQIWLVDVLNKKSSKVTRLSEFTSRAESKLRGDEDITQYYLKGQFGAIPTPDLFAALEEALSSD